MARNISVGVHPAVTDRSMPLLELAAEAEARELQSIYLPEHTHIPVGSEVLPGGHPMPDRYQRILDPFVAGAFVAATTSLEVGTAVSLIAEHDAIALAKALATLDFLSGGRLVLGIGFGYNRAEAEDHGFPAHDRALVVEETVMVMRQLWAEESGPFAGRYRSVSTSWAWPKPVRAGGPPILLGTRATPRNFERICTWADGWIPMAGAPLDDPELPGQLAELRRRWADSGRADSPQVCCFFDPAPQQDVRRWIDIAESLGVQRVQVFLEDRSRDEVLPILDEVAAAAT